MRLTVYGTTQSIEDWAEYYGIPCALIRLRLAQGWTLERAVTEPMPVRQGEKLTPDAMLDSDPPPAVAASWLSQDRAATSASNPETDASRRQRAKRAPRSNSRLYTHNGVSRTITEWADYLGISRQAMYLRLKTKGAEAFMRHLPRQC